MVCSSLSDRDHRFLDVDLLFLLGQRRELDDE